MKQYPTISKQVQNTPIIAFDKLDGSNIRAEWTRKNGFAKFGRRHGLLDHTNPILLRAPELILNTYGEELARIFRAQRWEKAVAFFEFYGPSSFAGLHEEGEQQVVTLIDVDVYKKGMLEPRSFLKLFRDSVPIPDVVHEGKANSDFVRAVQDGTHPGVTFEGVVCKGARIKNRPVMFKVKSRAWLDRLKVHCKGDEELFQKLA